jgi:hypothetical protein
MAHFTTGAKRYPESTDFPAFGGTDVGTVSNGTSFESTAPQTLPDGASGPRSFLFWDTGRRITAKRHVRWTFNNVANWSTWHAIAWYGTQPGGPGTPIVTVNSYWVGTGTMDPTPIDVPGSSFVNGPGGQPAFPWQGNNHAARTEWGPATIRALSHLQRSPTDPLLDFSSLTKLTFGGEDPGTIFEENDDGLVAGGGVTGIASTTAQQLTFPQGAGGLVLAGYVQPVTPAFMIPFIDIIMRWLGHVRIEPSPVDPGPDDIIRLKLIAESLDLVRGDRPTEIDAFEGLLAAAQKMSPAELKRTIVGTRATVMRGESALKSLEALAANQGSQKG